jgi:hypothetical protein
MLPLDLGLGLGLDLGHTCGNRYAASSLMDISIITMVGRERASNDLIRELWLELRSDMATGLPFEFFIHPPDDVVPSHLLAEHHAMSV